MSAEHLEHLGPYRVIRSLGRGGMGEVFLAHDPRLDRQVALKRIHRHQMPDGTDGTEARARFRREARIAAGLDHPGIVRVHDLLEVDGDLVLVMEHVPGRTLRELVDEHPNGLPVDRAVGLVRAVVRALAHAHAKGVVHRDLKTDNVLVAEDAADDTPKIADFGIARRFGVIEEEAGDGTAHTDRTATGLVVGTPRAMAPEQIRGGPVDHRADLFALGVLLHEVFAGRSPFAAATRADTLARVLTETPPRLDEIAPATPPPIADLAERLLAHDPRLRPRDAYEVLALLDPVGGGGGGRDADATALGSATWGPTALSTSGTTPPPRRSWHRVGLGAVALAAIVLAVVLWFHGRASARQPLVVAVLPVQQASEGGPELVFGLRLALQRSLDSLDGVVALSLAEVDAVSGSPRDVARAVGADELMGAHLACTKDQCELRLERIRAGDAAVVWSERAAFPADQPLVAAQAASAPLATAYPDHPPRPGSGGTFAEPDDYAEYLDIRRAADEPPVDTDALLARLDALRGRTPELAEIHLVEARLSVRAFRESRDPELLERAFRRIDTAEGLDPGAAGPLLQRLDAEIAAGRLAAAEATWTTLARQRPADARVIDLEATLREERGDLDRGLALRRRAVETRPSWQRWFNLARTAQLVGDTALARDGLARVLELVPDHPPALAQLARLELLAGDFARAADLYARLAERSPTASTLTNLGVARLYLGRLPAATEALEAALDRAPDHPQILLNLADVHLLQGDDRRARELYRRCAERAADDPAADTPGLLTVRAQALAHLGRPAEAVAAVQEAVARAPDDGGVAFEAAVVYALAGEQHSARAAARRAVEGGIEPAWFALPWFDPLRTDGPFPGPV